MMIRRGIASIGLVTTLALGGCAPAAVQAEVLKGFHINVEGAKSQFPGATFRVVANEPVTIPTCGVRKFLENSGATLVKTEAFEIRPATKVNDFVGISSSLYKIPEGFFSSKEIAQKGVTECDNEDSGSTLNYTRQKSAMAHIDLADYGLSGSNAADFFFREEHFFSNVPKVNARSGVGETLILQSGPDLLLVELQAWNFASQTDSFVDFEALIEMQLKQFAEKK
jgi:hypothetical protein